MIYDIYINIYIYIYVCIYIYIYIYIIIIYFLAGLFFTGTENSWDSRRRKETIFIYFYYFHPLTIIQIFTCNFAAEMTNTLF